MAIFERIGGPGAMFYVMPFLAGVAVWATYLMGTLVNGRLAGVIAAVLLATSPAFLFQLSHGPMSDIPAMAWWTIALVLLPRTSRGAALLSGLAVGVAIFTRPNLVPLVAIPAAFLAWEFASIRMASPLAFQRLLLFTLGVIPACLAVALLNDFWYGSPLASGYGQLGGALYRWDHFWPNLTTYTQRMVNSQSPAIFAAAAAPMLLWRHSGREEPPSRIRATVVAYSSFAFGLYVCYAFYAPLDTWWTLRFLFPAFPIIFVFLAVSILALRTFLPQDTRALAIVLLVGTLIGHQMAFGRRNFVLDSATEWRYATVGTYVAQRLPERAVLFAMLHGGSARYYSGRLTVRWDLIDPPLFERAIEHFQQRGYVPFLLVDRDVEHAQFVERFAGVVSPAMLERDPVTTIAGVGIYDLSQAPPAGPQPIQ
jgi:4-amino-4-deoxy-L-arabinose transferase-like glycosyltransferase